MKNINVPNDFSEYPAGRYYADGPFSGEALAHRVHMALATEEAVALELDGTRGYGGSFIDGFGDALKVRGWTTDQLAKRLILVTTDEALRKEFNEGLGLPSLHQV